MQLAWGLFALTAGANASLIFSGRVVINSLGPVRFFVGLVLLQTPPAARHSTAMALCETARFVSRDSWLD